jgi:hypothetical protein
VTFLNQQTKNRKIAIFMTHSAEEGMPEVAEWTGNCTKAATGAEVKGVFSCQGELAQSVADFMLISGNAALVNWAKMRPLTIGQPDAARLEKARLWARRIVSGRVQIPPPH